MKRQRFISSIVIQWRGILIFFATVAMIATIPSRASADPIRLLTSGTISALVDLADPVLSLLGSGLDNTFMGSNYFYGSGGTLSRDFHRGYMEFSIPPDLPDGFCAALNFSEIKGITTREDVPPDSHELSYYLGTGVISTDNYNLPKIAFATFQTDVNEPAKRVSIDVSSIVPAAQDQPGKTLGFEIRFLNNESEDPFCFSDDPQSPTDLISHNCFVDNALGLEFCGLNTKCTIDPNPPRIDLDSDCDGSPDEVDADDDNDTITDVCDNCRFVANTDQANTDADEFGDACDPAPFEDVDGLCPCQGPLTGGPANACSGPLFSDPWKNHGGYVSCVDQETGTLLGEGKISRAQKIAIVNAARGNQCGK